MYRSSVGTSRALMAGVAAGLVCLAGLTGCGRPGRGGVPVSGSVRLDGQPMSAGSVVFVPLGEGHKAAGEIIDGAFRIDSQAGPLPGQYRIEVYAPLPATLPLDDPLAFAQTMPAMPPPNAVSPRFNTRSGLSATVSPSGDNVFAFEVASR